MNGRRWGGLGVALFSPLPSNPVWMFWLAKQFKTSALDLVIVRDLRLALPTYIAARLCGIKVILDLGEHYPGMMEILGKQRMVHHVIRNHHLISVLEAMSVRLADYVWVVADENKERLGRYNRSIEVINNYPILGSISPSSRIAQREYSDTGDPVVLISLGLIDNIRGLDLAIDGFAILVRELGNIQMRIYGDGFFRDTLEEKVKNLGLQEKILFCGWVAENEKYDVLTGGDIGLLLHKVCDLTQYTIPNKLFDYMSAGLPVLATRLRPVVRVIESVGCGAAVDENPHDVAMEFRKLILDIETRRRYEKNGFDAVLAKFTWNSEADKVIGCVENLVRS